jgi:hypothetical protein
MSNPPCACPHPAAGEAGALAGLSLGVGGSRRAGCPERRDTAALRLRSGRALVPLRGGRFFGRPPQADSLRMTAWGRGGESAGVRRRVSGFGCRVSERPRRERGLGCGAQAGAARPRRRQREQDPAHAVRPYPWLRSPRLGSGQAGQARRRGRRGRCQGCLWDPVDRGGQVGWEGARQLPFDSAQGGPWRRCGGQNGRGSGIGDRESGIGNRGSGAGGQERPRRERGLECGAQAGAARPRRRQREQDRAHAVRPYPWLRD